MSTTSGLRAWPATPAPAAGTDAASSQVDGDSPSHPSASRQELALRLQLTADFELRTVQVRAEENRNYEARLEVLRQNMERAFSQKLESELQKRMAEKMTTTTQQQLSDSDSLQTLIETLFSDRPAEKRQAWWTTFDENEILTVGSLRRIATPMWARLNLPIGVEQALQDAIRPSSAPGSAPAPAPVGLPPAPQTYQYQSVPSAPVLTPTPPYSAPPPPTPVSYPPPSMPAPAPSGGARVHQVPGQSPCMIDDSQQLVTTMSGCPYPACGRDFEFQYRGSTKAFTPTECPACQKAVKPPPRLRDAVRLLATPAAATPVAGTAPGAPAPVPVPGSAVRTIETPGQPNVVVDEAQGFASTMSGCPYADCAKDFEFRFIISSQSYTPRSCPSCNRPVQAPPRLTSAAANLRPAPKSLDQSLKGGWSDFKKSISQATK